MRTKGWLDSMVLAVVALEPAHGYSIAATLQKDVGDLAGPSLYPVLKKLESLELVSADWDNSGTGPARKVYSITLAGDRRLQADMDEWRSVRAGVDGLFDRVTAVGDGRV